jgi:hypothetical protein
MKNCYRVWGCWALLLMSAFTDAGEIKKMMVMDPVYGYREVTYEKVGNYAIAEGDIILAKASSNPSAPEASMVKLQSKYWPDGIIPYKIDPNLPQANRDAVIDAIALWEKSTFVRFIPLTESNQSLYPDYVVFMPDGGKQCSSYVGRNGGKQYVLLSARCTTMITAHELGHVLGLWHEQSRADRDNYIRIMWENIDDRSKYNFEQHLTDGVDHGPYNYQSIMHYAPYAFSKNGEKTIVPLVDGVTIGQRKEISPLDIQAVNAMYPEYQTKD